jgi:NADP+-dependent farnesol dehydrogenase
MLEFNPFLFQEIIANNVDLSDRMFSVECDITKIESIKQAFKWIEDNLGGVDVLINNAGCLRNTTILRDDNESDLELLLQTNVMGLLICTKEAYKSMSKRDIDGYIVNLNSISGHSVPLIPGVRPMYSLYAGTKYAVTATTEVLRQELIYMKNLKVRVSVSFVGFHSSIII